VKLKVELSKIVEAMDFQPDETQTYLDRRSGEIVGITEDDRRLAEDETSDEDLPDWQKELVELARQIGEHEDDYLPLPSKFDIHEYKIMEDFCCSLPNQETSASLLDAIHGSGAFRLFKREIHRLGIQDSWYAFRAEAFKRIAREWCEENDIEWTED